MTAEASPLATWRRIFLTSALTVLVTFALSSKNRYHGPVWFWLTDHHAVHAPNVVMVLLSEAAVAVVWLI